MQLGHPIHNLAAQVLRDLGGETTDFAARQFTPKIAVSADLIITMTRTHRDRVLELAPRQLKRTFTLAEASQLAGRFMPQNITELAALRPQLAADQAPDPGSDRTRAGDLRKGRPANLRTASPDHRTLPSFVSGMI